MNPLTADPRAPSKSSSITLILSLESIQLDKFISKISEILEPYGTLQKRVHHPLSAKTENHVLHNSRT
jgi:hypothetical protein